MRIILAAAFALGVVLTPCVSDSAYAQMSEPEVAANQLRSITDYHARGHQTRSLAKNKSIPVHTRVKIQILMLAKELEEPTSHERIHGGIASITEYLQGQYIRALADIGSEAIPFLRQHLQVLEKAKKKTRVLESQCTLLSLGLLKADRVRPHIEEILLKDKDGMQRALAAYVLDKMEDKAAIPALIKALRDDFHVKHKRYDGQLIDYYPVREQAAGALRKLGVKLERNGWDFQIAQ